MTHDAWLMTPLYVRPDASLCETWLISIWDMTPLSVRHASRLTTHDSWLPTQHSALWMHTRLKITYLCLVDDTYIFMCIGICQGVYNIHTYPHIKPKHTRTYIHDQNLSYDDICIFMSIGIYQGVYNTYTCPHIRQTYTRTYIYIISMYIYTCTHGGRAVRIHTRLRLTRMRILCAYHKILYLYTHAVS